MIQIVPCANCGHDLHHVAEPHRCQTPGCDCPGLPGRDWPAFWSTLTDAEAAACLRAAPRVAGEWEQDEYEDIDATGAHNRRSIPGGVIVSYYYRDPTDDLWPWSVVGEDDEGHPSARSEVEARAACDSALRASGWRVIG